MPSLVGSEMCIRDRFNIIDQQRRDQAVNEANDAARQQTATRRDARSVAAAETKLQGNAADKPNGSQSTKTAGVKAERNRRYENNEYFVCGKQGHKQWDCPESQQGRREKAFMARVTARTPSCSCITRSSSNPQAVPLSVAGAKPSGWPLRLPPLRLELVGTRPPQKRWLRESNHLQLRRLRTKMTTCLLYTSPSPRD